MLEVDTPTTVRILLQDEEAKKLGRHLEYIDKKVDYEIKRLKDTAHWYQDDLEAYQAKIENLKSQRKKSLLFKDEKGYWTYSGLAPKLAAILRTDFESHFVLPAKGTIPWENIPKHQPRDYQLKAHDELIHSAHLGPRRVEIGTGLGKSTIIRMVIKTLSLKTVVMAPSKNIATQLYEDYAHHFGKRRVGMFGNGKKQSDKLIVIGIDDSLTKVEEGSEHWDNLSSAKVFIADESHLCPAETLSRVCFGLCANAPYRFFFSGTQVRSDGLDLVLDGITGETVFSMTVKEGVDQGYLARPYFRMVSVTSDLLAVPRDPNMATRKALYYNPRVIKVAADLANKFVSVMKRPTVILVEEVEQFAKLLPFLKHPVKFAHGPLQDNKNKVPQEYWESNPNELVDSFNRGEIPILVGTSCIATGTDLQAVGATIYLMGKSSEVKVKQAVGRDTRGGKRSFVTNPWTGEQKLDCIHVDFDVTNVDSVHRHALIRKALYNEIYGPVEDMVL